MKFRDLTSGSGKSFLKLKPGESVRGVFRGDVVDFRNHWVNNRSVICPGSSKCDVCREGEKSHFRFRVNLIIRENGAYVAKIFENGRTVFESLKAIHEGDYNLEKHQMNITRRGASTDTTYTIVPVANGSITADQEKQIAQVPLIPLEIEEPHQAEPVAAEDVPF